jgi:hypothetical protein
MSNNQKPVNAFSVPHLLRSLVLGLGLLAGATACSGSESTSPRTRTVLVTATDGTTTHTVPIAVTFPK